MEYIKRHNEKNDNDIPFVGKDNLTSIQKT